MPSPPPPPTVVSEFEKSVSGLEADLRRLPGAKPLSQVERSNRNTFTSDCDSEIMNRFEKILNFCSIDYPHETWSK